jgi:hypothetical protein
VTPPGDDNGTSADDPDLGPPVTELRQASIPLGDRFVTRVRSRIERRVLAGEALELLWTAPATILLLFLRWPFE